MELVVPVFNIYVTRMELARSINALFKAFTCFWFVASVGSCAAVNPQSPRNCEFYLRILVRTLHTSFIFHTCYLSRKSKFSEQTIRANAWARNSSRVLFSPQWCACTNFWFQADFRSKKIRLMNIMV